MFNKSCIYFLCIFCSVHIFPVRLMENMWPCNYNLYYCNYVTIIIGYDYTTWFAITHALLTASASTSSGRDKACPSGPVTPLVSNFFVFCNPMNTLSSTWELFSAHCNVNYVYLIHSQNCLYDIAKCQVFQNQNWCYVQ